MYQLHVFDKADEVAAARTAQMAPTAIAIAQVGDDVARLQATARISLSSVAVIAGLGLFSWVFVGAALLLFM